MGGIFGGPKTPPQKTIPAQPVPETTLTQNERDKTREASARRTSAATTILTSGLGMPGDAAPVRKTTLGGR